MILAFCVALATFSKSAVSNQSCQTLGVQNYAGQDTVIGQPKQHIYLSANFSLLLNSSELVKEPIPTLCVNRTDCETQRFTTLGCINSSADSHISHEVIGIREYYMLHIIYHDYTSGKYTWWLNYSETIVAESIIELLPNDSRRKIFIRKERSTTVIHHFGSNAKDIAIHRIEDQQISIATAGLKNGAAVICNVMNLYKKYIFLAANSSYLSLTFSSEFTFYGNYSIIVTYSKNNSSTYSLEVVQGGQTRNLPSASSDKEHKVLFACLGSAVPPLLLLIVCTIIYRKRIQKRLCGQCADKQTPIEPPGPNENVDAQEPTEDAKLIVPEDSTDERVAGSLPSKATFADDGDIKSNNDDDQGRKGLDPLNVLFLNLGKQLSDDDQRAMMDLLSGTHINKSDEKNLKTPYDVFKLLRERGHITESNLELLKDVFRDMDRRPLIGYIDEYLKNKDRPSMEQESHQK